MIKILLLLLQLKKLVMKTNSLKVNNQLKETKKMYNFEIYFSDLTEDAQKRLCEEFKTTPENENWTLDIIPLAILNREEKDEN